MGERVGTDETGPNEKMINPASSRFQRNLTRDEKIFCKGATSCRFCARERLARLARVVVANVPHHVTQRGNARRFLLDCDTDRKVYLELLREDTQCCRVAVLGYCLMSNHVHLVLFRQGRSVSESAEANPRTLRGLLEYALSIERTCLAGKILFLSFGLHHLWRALRDTELNPVRAGLVAEARSWKWSSAAFHCGELPADGLIQLDPWRRRWSDNSWSQYLKAGENESDETAFVAVRLAGDPWAHPNSLSSWNKRQDDAWRYANQRLRKLWLQMRGRAN